MIGVAIPLYLLQAGIKHTEPITAAIVPSLSPLVAYLLQLPVGRLKASALTLAGVLAIVILVARHDARYGHDVHIRRGAAKSRPVISEHKTRAQAPIGAGGSIRLCGVSGTYALRGLARAGCISRAARCSVRVERREEVR